MTTKVPRFELKRVYDDGTETEPQLIPVTRLPWQDVTTDRRGLLGAGVAASAALATCGVPGCGAPVAPVAGPTGLAHPKKAGVKDIVVSRDGKWLASTTWWKPFINSPELKGEIKLWSLPEGRLVKQLEVKAQISKIEITPDGKLLIAVWDNPAEVTVWSIPDGKLLKTARFPFPSMGGEIPVSLDGRYFALMQPSTQSSTPNEGLVHVISLPDLKQVCQTAPCVCAGKVWFSNKEQTFHALAWATGTDGILHSWSLLDGKLIATRAMPTSQALGPLPDGTLITLRGPPELSKGQPPNSLGNPMPVTLTIRSLFGDSPLGTIEPFECDPIDNECFTSPDNRILVRAPRPNVQRLIGSVDPDIKLWSLPDGKLLKTMTLSTGKDIVVRRLVPGGETLVVGKTDGTIVLQDLIANGSRRLLRDVALDPAKTEGASPVVCTCNQVCTCIPVYY